MKKVLALTLVALAAAACDVGVAGSSSVQPAEGSKPAMCPTMGGGKAADGDCGSCPSSAKAAKSECSDAPCGPAPGECGPMDCDSAKKECGTEKCDSTKTECAPKSGN